MSLNDEGRVLGDYRLKRLMHETPRAYQWLAEQLSIGRTVLVDELKPEASDQRDEFLADVRAKAAIEIPLIASVYEAVAEEGESYFAHEYLPGGSLEARKEAGEPMKTVALAQLLKRIAAIQKQFEKQGLSSSPLALDHVHLDSHGVLRLANLVLHGERSDHESMRDMTYLGRALLPMVADGQEGATRMLTLLSWMRGEGGDEVEGSLSWAQVIDLCERIERQLTGEPLVTRRAPEAGAEPEEVSRRLPMGLIVMTGVLALAVIILLAIRARPNGPPPGYRAALPEPVMIPARRAAGPERPAMPAFRMAAHEVTIGEYLEFLETLDALEKAEVKRSVFDHREQPAEKISHEPDDWESLLTAARKSWKWNGWVVTLDTPVVGVDWWDAVAYCEWKKGHLPQEEEWVAALGADPSVVASMPPSGWGPVDPASEDRTAYGVLNLAGSVSEWTFLPTADPVNPLGEKKWLILGGSYLDEQGHALSREWIDDRSLRRPDLGFRVVFDAE